MLAQPVAQIVNPALPRPQDTYRSFMLQLAGLAALFKGLAVLMDGSSPPLGAGPWEFVSGLLVSGGSSQYLALVAVMAVVYPAIRCVGDWRAEGWTAPMGGNVKEDTARGLCVAH